MQRRELPRLTEARLQKAEAKGKVAGWYKLLCDGYLAEEIEVHAVPVVSANDVRQRVRLHAENHDLPVPAQAARKRDAIRKAPPDDYRAAFRAKVMRVGMTLHLSQAMLEYLCAVADDVIWDRLGASHLGRPDNVMATAPALEQRGLIARKPQTRSRADIDDYAAYHVLTPLGEKLVALLKEAGIFQVSDRAHQKRARKS